MKVWFIVGSLGLFFIPEQIQVSFFMPLILLVTKLLLTLHLLL